MFLHIGNNILLHKDDIIGIYNVDALKQDAKGKKFLNEVRQNEEIEDISEGKWSSIIMTNDKLYVSRISTATLLARSREEISELLVSNRRPMAAQIRKTTIVRKPS